jgi:putative transposase
VLAAFLYHAGLSFRRIEPIVDRSYEAIRQWWHRLRHLFEPDRQHREVIAVDETAVEVDGEEYWVWAAVDTDTFEVVHVDVSPGQSALEAYLFLHEVLQRCRGRPVVKADRGPWYNWPLDDLSCAFERETFGERSLIEAWFSVFKDRTRRFWGRFPYRSSPHSLRRWARAFAAIHNATL